jgi:DNA-binding GntR family transcriptional regulator
MEEGLGLEATSYQSLVDLATQQLREAIFNGQLKPDTHLVETKIAEELKVSRLTLREALRRLEQEGLVVNYPRRGAFVTRLSQRDAEEICVTRALLEGFAARLACKNLGPDKLKRLSELVNEMYNSADSSNLAEIVKRDLEFHEIICLGAGNRWLYQAWSILNSKIGALFVTTLEKENLSLEYAAQQHRDVYEAIASGNPDWADQVVRNHYLSTRNLSLNPNFIDQNLRQLSSMVMK